MNLAIALALLASLLSCYFAACHIALKTFSRKRLATVLEERGHLDRLDTGLARLPKLLLLTGTLRTLLGLIVLLAMLYALETQLHDWPMLAVYAAAFGVAAVLVSVFAVAVPVSWARYRREDLLAWSLPLLGVLLTLLLPFASALHLFDPVVRRLSGTHADADDENLLSDQVMSVVEEHDTSATVDEAQKEMLEAVFDLPTTTAAEIMTPRTDVDGIEVSSTLAQVKAAILEFGHSRIPVYEDNLDHILGLLYAKDMIRFVGDGETFDLRTILREAYMVPQSKSVRELLSEFKARKVHIAIVLDEYGGTAGLITIEDILEEIVGDIQDEYELLEEPPHIEVTDANGAEVDARVHIDDFNDTLHMELPEDEDYDTVGGFVTTTLGHIPEAGESFEFGSMRFTVLDAERTKVKRIAVQRLESEPNEVQG